MTASNSTETFRLPPEDELPFLPSVFEDFARFLRAHGWGYLRYRGMVDGEHRFDHEYGGYIESEKDRSEPEATVEYIDENQLSDR